MGGILMPLSRLKMKSALDDPPVPLKRTGQITHPPDKSQKPADDTINTSLFL